MSKNPLDRVEEERREKLLNPYSIREGDQFDDEYTIIPLTPLSYISAEEGPIFTPQEAAKPMFYFGEDDDDEYP
jgi:hypothetical protein